MNAGRLLGWRVLVTRQPEQAAGLAEALRSEGASVIEVPLIEIAPPADATGLRQAIEHLADYDWLVFTSANAVRAFAIELSGRALPEGLRIATVGPSTSEAVTDSLPGASVSLQPAEDFRAEGLLAAFAADEVAGQRVLIPAAARARDTLASGLTARGARVDVVTAYRTLTPADAPRRLAAALAEGVDVVTLASPSAVEGFVSACPPGTPRPRALVIGPVTEKAARQAGLEVAGVGGTAGPEGIVQLLAHLTRTR
jgi:uroporphyrinogen III methyltransferase / synthase